MKKIISTLLTTLLVALCFTTNISAASVSSKVSANTVKVGDTFEFYVMASGTVTSGSIEISCSSNLTVVSGQWLLSGTKIADFGGVKGVMSFDGAKAISGNYFKVVLKATAVGAASVSASVQLSNDGSSVGGGTVSANVNVICANHSFKETSRKEATCTQAGSITKTCSVCNTVETTTIAALGHNVSSYTTTKEPTCDQQGSKSGTCSRCNQNVTVAINAKGHTYGSYSITKEATCTTPGSETRECSVCGAKDSRDTALAQHILGDERKVIQEATIYQKGIAEGYCVNCSAAFTEEITCTHHDENTGLHFQCDEGVFKKDTIIEVKQLNKEEIEAKEKVNQLLQDMGGRYVAYNIHALLEEQEVQPDGTVKVVLNIPEEFSDNVALFYLDEDGNRETANCIVDSEAKTLTAYLDRLGLCSLVEISPVIVQNVEVVNGTWFYVAIGEAVVIALLAIFLIVVANKKKQQPIHQDSISIMNGDDADDEQAVIAKPKKKKKVVKNKKEKLLDQIAEDTRKR